jgi:uncharacterized protein
VCVCRGVPLLQLAGSSLLCLSCAALAPNTWIPLGRPAEFLLALFLVVVGPIWDYIETLPLRAKPSGALRMRFYVRTIVWLWVATGVAVWAVGFSSLVTLDGIGIHADWLERHAWGWWIIAVLVVLVVLLQMVLPVIQVSVKYRDREFLEPKQLEPMRFFLPASTTERRCFVLLCLTAGICEEILFRGFLIRYFHTSPFRLALLAAVVISAVVFGTHHFYQGMKGFISTSIGGLVFAGILLVTGSLWAGMAYHAATDMTLLLYWRPRKVEV